MRRIVVTGANKGIGRAIVEGLLEEHEDTFVYLGARSEARGAAARSEMIDVHPSWASRVEVLPLDVTSDASVQAARAHVEERGPLYGVVSNAGIGSKAGSMRDVLDVNTRGVRRVCEAFVPSLDPDRGRVVVVTSASGPIFVSKCSPERRRFFVDPEVTWPQLEALMDECLALDGPDAFAAAGLGDGSAYGLSKACANTYVIGLARRHPKLAVNACTPGFIETDMTRGYLESSGETAETMGMKPPSAGARAPLHLLFGALEGNGWYYGSDAVRSPLDAYRSPGDPPYRG